MIRAIRKDDYDELRYIHEKYYQSEFSFPDFVNKYLCAFIVTDDDTGDIITAAGVRTIAEVIALTNKDFSVKSRREALYRILEASIFVSAHSGYEQIHAFVQDGTWLKQLKKAGFKDCVGQPVYMNVK